MDIQETVDQVFDEHCVDQDSTEVDVRRHVAYAEVESIADKLEDERYDDFLEDMDECVDAFFMSLALENQSDPRGNSLDSKMLSAFGRDQGELSQAADKLKDHVRRIYERDTMVKGLAMEYATASDSDWDMRDSPDVHKLLVDSVRERYEDGRLDYSELRDLNEDKLHSIIREDISEEDYRRFEAENREDLCRTLDKLVTNGSKEYEPDIEPIMADNDLKDKYDSQIRNLGTALVRMADNSDFYSCADEIYSKSSS